MLALQDFGLERHGEMSLSCSQYTGPWNGPLFGAESAFISQHSTPTLKLHNLSPVSLSSGRGDSIAMPLGYGCPTRSSSACSSWAMSTAGSDNDSSIASDEEQEDMPAGIEEKSLSVVNAAARGPCSKTWSLPPVCRIVMPTDVFF
jgi:hypothetical protein